MACQLLGNSGDIIYIYTHMYTHIYIYIYVSVATHIDIDNKCRHGTPTFPSGVSKLCASALRHIAIMATATFNTSPWTCYLIATKPKQ